MAVAHTILVILYHLLAWTGPSMTSRGMIARRPDRRSATKQRALAALERLGDNVTLSPVT